MIFYPVNDSKWLQEVVFGCFWKSKKMVPLPDVEVCVFTLSRWRNCCCRCSIRGSLLRWSYYRWRPGWRNGLAGTVPLKKKRLWAFFLGGTLRVLHKKIGNNQFWERFSPWECENPQIVLLSGSKKNPYTYLNWFSFNTLQRLHICGGENLRWI